MGSRSYIFTINNPQGDFLLVQDPQVRYCVFQYEIAPSTGTLHAQGYIELHKPQRIAFMKKLSATAHWEVRRGTRDQARAYAMKTDTRVAGPFEFGNWESGGHGSRNDLRSMYDEMKSGANIRSILESHTEPAFKYHGAVSKYMPYFEKKRDWEMEVHVLIGDPGTGKTRQVWEKIKDKDYYIKEPSNKWWDGYDGQEIILIDDYIGQFDFTYLLRLLDRYPMQLEIKGGSRQMLGKTIYITSNVKPENWYRQCDTRALLRRFTSVTMCNEVAGVILNPAPNDSYQEMDLTAFA